MSKYRRCRVCDRDLGHTRDEVMGSDECCCNSGYCFFCCVNEEDSEDE